MTAKAVLYDIEEDGFSRRKNLARNNDFMV